MNRQFFFPFSLALLSVNSVKGCFFYAKNGQWGSNSTFDIQHPRSWQNRYSKESTNGKSCKVQPTELDPIFTSIFSACAHTLLKQRNKPNPVTYIVTQRHEYFTRWLIPFCKPVLLLPETSKGSCNNTILEPIASLPFFDLSSCKYVLCCSVLVISGCYNKYHRVGHLNNKRFFLIVWWLESPRAQRQTWCLARAHSLVCRWPSCCLLTRQRDLPSMSLLIKTLIPFTRVPPS